MAEENTISINRHHHHHRLVLPAKQGSIHKGVVLMIHGFGQNAKIMNMKSKYLTKKLNQAGYDCIFLQAPHKLPTSAEGKKSDQDVNSSSNSKNNDNDNQEDACAWYFYNAENPLDISEAFSGKNIEYVGMEESLRLITEELGGKEREEKIHVLGFSQGAAFAHFLASLAEQNASPFKCIDKFVLVSGFPSTPTGYSEESLSQLTRPSLHVVGSKDAVVLPSNSQKLQNRFVKNSRRVLDHEKGHIVPQQSAQCKEIIDFLNE